MIEHDNSNIFSELPEGSRNIISNSVTAVIVIILLILVLSCLRSVMARYAGVSESTRVFHTSLEIKAVGANTGEGVKIALRSAAETAGLIDYYDSNSDISAVNNMAGISAVAVSHDVFNLIDNALKLCRQTGGAFDITIGPLTDIWNFNKRPQKNVPSGNELVYAQHLVSYNNVQMNPINETVKLLYPGMKIDLSGAEKGFVISKARSELVQKGIKSAIIRCGSSIAVVGDNKGKPWKIGIKDPSNPLHDIGYITLEAGQAAATSADYEKYFVVGGMRFHNILNPTTGMPANECRSVTIINDDATQADMLSKAVFVMGPKRGMDFVKMFKGINAVIIDKDGKVETTPTLVLLR